jgi:hypothetical protein
MVRTGMPTGGRAANSNAPILEKNVLGRCERCVKTPVCRRGVLTLPVMLAGDNTGLGSTADRPLAVSFLMEQGTHRIACGTGRFFAKKEGRRLPWVKHGGSRVAGIME